MYRLIPIIFVYLIVGCSSHRHTHDKDLPCNYSAPVNRKVKTYKDEDAAKADMLRKGPRAHKIKDSSHNKPEELKP